MLELLRGLDNQSQSALENLINEISNNERIAWYPSAGQDFRDIYEISNSLHIKDKPNLYIHTDYLYDWTNYDNPLPMNYIIQPGLVENSFGGIITQNILSVYELEFIDIPSFYTDPKIVHFPNPTPDPTILLLYVEVSHLGITFTKPVLYFPFENYNFLDVVILENKIKINILVKVRDGSGYGGGSDFSISNIFPYVNTLGTEFILSDSEIRKCDFELITKLNNNHLLFNSAFDLNIVDTITGWSGHDIKVAKITKRIKEPYFNSSISILELGK